MRLRVCTFNTGSFLARGPENTELTLGPQRYARKCRFLGDVFDRLRPDVVACQEVSEEQGILDSLAASESSGDLRVVGASEPASRGTRTWLLSRFPLAPGTQVEIHQDDVPELTWEGASIRPLGTLVHAVLLPRPGQVLHVLATHLKSKRSWLPGNRPIESLTDWGLGAMLSTAKRAAQAVQVRRVVDGILMKNVDARVCVMGDFNDLPYSPTIEIMLGDHQAAGRLRLRKLELMPVSASLPGSKRFSHVYRGRRQLLDDILASRGLWRGFVGAEAHNASLEFASPAAEFEFSESDHAPVTADFRI